MTEQKGAKFYGPNVKVSSETLEKVRRERDGLSVIQFTVLSLGGETREVELTGVLPDEATPTEVILELRKALLIASEKTVLLTSVVDLDEPVFRSQMAREAKVVALIIDKNLAQPITSPLDKKYRSENLKVAAEKGTDEYILDLLVLPRTLGNKPASGGKLRGLATTSNFTGKDSFFRPNAGGLIRSIFDTKLGKEVFSGSHTDYVMFLVLPEHFQMGQLPLADFKNDEYWQDQAILTCVLVPKELV